MTPDQSTLPVRTVLSLPDPKPNGKLARKKG